MSNIFNIQDYFKQEVELTDEDNLAIAQKNGFQNFEDYAYSIAKEYSVNPSFSLSREYYNLAQVYLVNTLRKFLNYTKNYEIDGSDITIYALNELITELNKGNEDLMNILKSEGLSLKEFLTIIQTTTLEKVSENNLGLKRGI